MKCHRRLLFLGALLQVSVQSAKIHGNSTASLSVEELANASSTSRDTTLTTTRVFQLRAMQYFGDSDLGLGMVGEVSFRTSQTGPKLECTCTTQTTACEYDTASVAPQTPFRMLATRPQTSIPTSESPPSTITSSSPVQAYQWTQAHLFRRISSSTSLPGWNRRDLSKFIAVS